MKVIDGEDEVRKLQMLEFLNDKSGKIKSKSC